MSGGRDDAHSHIASAAAIWVQHADEINSLPLAADNGQLRSGWRTRRSWRRSGLAYGAAANGCQDCYQREPRIAHPCPPVLRKLSADGVDHQRWADPFEAFLDRGVGDDLTVSGTAAWGRLRRSSHDCANGGESALVGRSPEYAKVRIPPQGACLFVQANNQQWSA